jgi:hypothetical protein
MFPNHNIHKYSWISPYGKTHSQFNHILIDKRQHSNMVDVQSFRGADCDTDHYLVPVKVSQRLSVNKQAAKKSNMERYNLKKLNDVEVKEQYQVKISDLQLWEIWMMMMHAVLGKLLDRI